MTEKYRFGLLSAAGLRQQDLGQSINLLEWSVPEEQAGFEHFQLNDAPAVVGVSKEVDPGVGPRSWSDGDGPLGDIQDLWRRCPRLVFRAKIILNPVIPRHWNFLHAVGWGSAPIQHREFTFDHDVGAKGLQKHLVHRLEQRGGVLLGQSRLVGYREGEGSTGGGANSRFEEGLISAKIFGLLDGFEAISRHPNGGHGGDAGFRQVLQVPLVHIPSQGRRRVTQLAFGFTVLQPLVKGFGMVLVVPREPGDHKIECCPIDVFVPIGGLHKGPLLPQGIVQWLVVHFPFGQVLAFGQGQSGHHAIEGILSSLFPL